MCWDQNSNTAGSGTVTVTSNVGWHGRMGWECPKCGQCYAPHVERCQTCGQYTYPPYVPGTITTPQWPTNPITPIYTSGNAKETP